MTGRRTLGLLALLAAAPHAHAQTSMLATAPTTLLRLEGSNTVGDKLAPNLLRAWAQKQGLDAVRTIEGQAPDESELVATGPENGRQLRASVHAHGTGSGLDKLLAGAADLWMASRQANPAELAKADRAGLGPLLDAAHEHPIALDALLVIVHRDNPLRQLGIDQIADVFAGKITRWNQLGGRDAPIDLYSRDAKSGTYDTFANLVLRGRALAPGAKLFEGASEDLSDEVASDPNGIGFIGFAYERSARALAIASSCGLVAAPAPFAVKSGEYPLSRRLYFYTGAQTAPPVADFVAFAQSLDAQHVVAASDFIDFAPALATPRYTADRLDAAADARDGGQVAIRGVDLARLEEATTGARRLSVSLGFLAGSYRLDSLALADIGRLAQVLRQPPYAGARVVLIGFSQSQGDYALNRATSSNRAQAVKRELEARGVAVDQAVGVGPAAPIACNTDDASRARNQRVEVWVRMPTQP